MIIAFSVFAICVNDCAVASVILGLKHCAEDEVGVRAVSAALLCLAAL